MFHISELVRVVVVLLEERVRPVLDVLDVEHGGGKSIGWLCRTFRFLYWFSSFWICDSDFSFCFVSLLWPSGVQV